VLYQQAQEHRQAGRPTEALAALADAEVIDDQYADLFFLKGSLLYGSGAYEQANAALRRARDEDICPVRALTSISDAVAEVAAEQGVPLVDYLAMIDRRSEHAVPGEQYFLDHVHPTIEGNRLLALALTDLLIERDIVHPAPSWNEEAVAAVAQAVEQRVDHQAHAEALLKLSKVLTWAGKFEEARPLAARASALLADNAESFYTLALTTEKAGDTAGAIRYYRRALELRPDYASAHCNLGILLAAQGHVEEAIGHYRKVLEIEPDHANAHNNLGAAIARQGQAEEGMKHCREALRIRPDLAEAHDNLGTILTGQGKLEAAAACHREALRIRPEFALAHYHLASVLAKQGLLADAVDHYRQALRAKPDFADAYGMLGGVLLRQGKTAEAATEFRAALRLRPGWVEVANNLAWILATHESPQIRNGAEAVALAEQACEATQGKIAGTLDTLAAAYAEAGRFEDASGTARKALSLAREAGDESLARALEQRLTLYETGRPYRDVP